MTQKYASIAFTHWTASLVSPEKLAGRAALICMMLVVVDTGFAGDGGGLVGGCGSGTVGGGAVVNKVVVSVIEVIMVTRGMIDGKGLVIRMLG